MVTSDSSSINLKWFAVYTRFNAEKKVEERLALNGFDCFLPLHTVVKKWSDRTKSMQVPLIRSYVFVKSTKRDLANIYQVTGVVNVLKYLGNYAIVKNAEIENLRILSKNGFPMKSTSTAINLSKGTKVNVLNGPFKGLDATYLMNSGKHKVVVEIEALSSYIEVTMPLDLIQNL